jgi:hypothetical protein
MRPALRELYLFAIACTVGADLRVCPELGLHATTGADTQVCPYIDLQIALTPNSPRRRRERIGNAEVKRRGRESLFSSQLLCGVCGASAVNLDRAVQLFSVK